MRTSRRITLELLREGEAHNQLLSKITPYLALCGNHVAASVRLPLDQRDFLLEQPALRYDLEAGAPAREDAQVLRAAHLSKMGGFMTTVLRQVRALNTEAGACPRHPDDLIHLDLVLSASELAMLPFEAALVPEGMVGAGAELQLQWGAPITLTRRVRRALSAPVQWPRQPRILVVIASPPTVEEVPAKAHVKAIEQAIAPWVHKRRPATDFVTVLTNASLSSVKNACSANRYTHVHILAHGRAERVLGGHRYGLVFHRDRDAAAEEVVGGQRLVDALRTHLKEPGGPASHPAVVTLASCDSGNVGDLITPGASLAHALHESGIPLVIASQYPLSYEGSVILAQRLYKRLFWGEDPLVALHDVRQELSARSVSTHDWASIVAYASFPADFETDLRLCHVERANEAASAALARSDDRRAQSAPEDPGIEEKELKEALNWLESAVPDSHHANASALTAEIRGRQASIAKRRAQAFHESDNPELKDRELRELREARDLCKKGVQADPSAHWLMSQYIALCYATEDKIPPEWLTTARQIAKLCVESADRHKAAWAHGTLAEIELLSTLRPVSTDREQAFEEAKEHIDRMIEIAGRASFHVESTRRQFSRYADWWGGKIDPALGGLALRIVELLK